MTEGATAGPPENPAPATDDEVVARAKAISEALSLATARPTDDLTNWEQLRHADYKQDMELRKKYADWVIAGLGVQLAVADAIFFLYAWHGRHWNLPTTAIEAWLAAAVVQVIGIVLVVTRYLFPRRTTGA